MDPPDDYADLDLPPPSGVVTFFSRRLWYWLLALVVVNVLALGAWRQWHSNTRCYCCCYGPIPHCDKDGLFFDPVESDPSAQDAIAKADEAAEKELAVIGMTPGPGYRQAFWSAKQRILKDTYGIGWRTPAEMNPNMSFD